MTTTAAYLRVSSDNQDVARQRESIESWAAREGVSIAHWFEDSEGRNPRDLAAKRVGFQNMLDAVRGGMIKKIVVDSQDRFGTRDAYQLGQFITLLKDNDCELWSVMQGHLTADDDATILTNTLGALTSTREQKEKALRNIGGKIQKAKAGEYQGGYPPFGLDVVCFNGHEKWRVQWIGHYDRWKIYPTGERERFEGKNNFPAKDANDVLRYRPSTDEKRLEVVRNIFQWFATEAVSTGQIADRLNSLGITTTVGSPWNKVIIKQLLQNPAYLGFPSWNKRGGSRFKEYVDGQIKDVKNKTLGRKRKQADYVAPKQVEFEPIIDSEIWDAVQAKFASVKPSKRRAPQIAELWLRPFLHCGHCGKPMWASNPQPRMDYGSYFCGTYGTYGKNNPAGCRCHRVKHSLVEALVDKYLEETGQGLEVLANCGDADLFEAAYSEWSKAITAKNRLWAKMNESASPATTAESIWSIEQRYSPSDEPEIQARIDELECELDESLAGFVRLLPSLQDRANKRMEALQAEIESLQAQIEDLRAPWEAVSREAHQRQKAMAFAASLAKQDGPKRAEALHNVVDKILCHFRYEGKKSILDALEIIPVDGDCFRVEIKQGPD